MKISYCIECGKPLAKLSTTEYQCQTKHMFWNNPKGAAGVLFKRGNEYMYAIRAREPFKGMLDIVGGYMEFGESAIDAVIREVNEETGVILEPKNLKLLGTFTALYESNISVLALVYVCSKWEGEFKAADDVSGFLWGPIELLASKRYAFQSKELKELVNAAKNF